MQAIESIRAEVNDYVYQEQRTYATPKPATNQEPDGPLSFPGHIIKGAAGYFRTC